MALGPQFFIIRRHEMQTISPDGQTICEQTHTIVPLIPVDLLPEWVEVCSVPRRLDLEDTTGMTNLGTFDAAEQVLGLQFTNPPQTGEDTNNNNNNNNNNNGPAVLENGNDIFEGKKKQQESYDVKEGTSTTHSRDAAVSSDRTYKPQTWKTPPPLQQQPQQQEEQEEQRTCQAWCHHGICPRGKRCHWQHLMPQTMQGLKKIGLERFPPWYCRATKLAPGASPATSRGAETVSAWAQTRAQSQAPRRISSAMRNPASGPPPSASKWVSRWKKGEQQQQQQQQEPLSLEEGQDQIDGHTLAQDGNGTGKDDTRGGHDTGVDIDGDRYHHVYDGSGEESLI